VPGWALLAADWAVDRKYHLALPALDMAVDCQTPQAPEYGRLIINFHE